MIIGLVNKNAPSPARRRIPTASIISGFHHQGIFVLHPSGLQLFSPLKHLIEKCNQVFIILQLSIFIPNITIYPAPSTQQVGFFLLFLTTIAEPLTVRKSPVYNGMS